MVLAAYKIKNLRFRQDFSVTGYNIPIFLAAQDYIAEVPDSTCVDFGLKIASFPSPSLTMKEIVFYTINHRIIIDAIWSYPLSHY